MLDFTSALYLGLQHPSRMLRPWSSLTSGRPAALGASVEQGQLARALARLQGTEAAVLGPSTLHLFWDLFDLLARPGHAVYVDAGAYAISRWGAERAGLRAVPIQYFRHNDARELQQQLLRDSALGLHPIVVADGFCPGCGRPAPISAYLQQARTFGGMLVLDDTQALGVLGATSALSTGFGSGGGGSLRHSGHDGTDSKDVVLVSSLAKGFGVPVAVLCGSAELVERFMAHSATRVHCSPPSVAVVRAAENALQINRSHGDALREQLARRVRRLRAGLMRLGLSSGGGLFPVQTLQLHRRSNAASSPSDCASMRKNGSALERGGAEALHTRLLQDGLQTVLHAQRIGARACISLLVTAAHLVEEVDRAVELIGATLDMNLNITKAGSAGTEVDHARHAFRF